MSLVNFNGRGPRIDDGMMTSAGTPSYSTNSVIDAAGEMVAAIGQIRHATLETGTINIRKVWFRLGALTFNVLSTVRVSLQNVSLTGGPPYQPDGSQDQTYDFALGLGLTANAINSTGNLSADRAVDLSATGYNDADSSWVAVVFEFQTFTALDSLILSGIMRPSSAGSQSPDVGIEGNLVLRSAAGVWSLLSGSGNAIWFECDDGSLAFFNIDFPYSALSSASVASNGAIRSAGLKFSLPVPLEIDMAGLSLVLPNNSDGVLELLDSDGTTVLRSLTLDNDAMAATVCRMTTMKFPPLLLSANTDYYLFFRATTTTAASVFYGDVNSAPVLDCFPGGQDFTWVQKDSVGAITETTTRRPHCILGISAVHDGSGGGGNTYSRSRVVNA